MPRGVDTERTKERIILSALEVFGESGFQGASLEEVARRAGVTKGALYWHFKDKLDLYMAVFDHALGEYARSLRASFDTDEPPRQALSNLAKSIFAIYSDNELVSRFYASMMMDSKLMGEEGMAVRAARAYNDYRQAIAALFARWASLDGLTRLDPGVAALGYVALIDGIAMQWMIDRTGFDLVRNGMEAVDMFLDGIDRSEKG